MDAAKLQELRLLGTVTFYLIITLLVFSYVTVGLRLWVRYRITRSPGWDDAAMVTTLLLFTSYCAFIFVITFRSMSMQRELFSEQGIHVTLIYVQLSEVFYILTTTLLKVSLGLFFLRVLTKRWQTLIFHVILVISGTYGLFYVFVTVFQCGDPTKLADSLLSLESPRCLPSAFLLTTGYLYGIMNILADWTFVLIPISVLVDSDLDRRSKISVSLVMALGAVGSVSSILRMVYLKGLSLSGNGLSAMTVKATIWATAEPGTGIIAASIAILRPLVRKIASGMRTKASSYSHTRKSSQQTEDSIALTEQESVAQTKNMRASVYSLRSDGDDGDCWSPTIVGTADVQRMIVVKGKMIQRGDDMI
ncbi:integral membrane protein [Decorospora gaudefroyi]|uniref:Integral membrane protein n=1 Tax=Decorospora gaudefroyi TaxID=184978 RepID=A0A6A5KI09_9PLEO|nr:integral membrane protein [Decorospora gaudefroyi]